MNGLILGIQGSFSSNSQCSWQVSLIPTSMVKLVAWPPPWLHDCYGVNISCGRHIAVRQRNLKLVVNEIDEEDSSLEKTLFRLPPGTAKPFTYWAFLFPRLCGLPSYGTVATDSALIRRTLHTKFGPCLIIRCQMPFTIVMRKSLLRSSPRAQAVRSQGIHIPYCISHGEPTG